MTEPLPEPECRLGYTGDQLDEILGDDFDQFWEWMYGQTMSICGGPADGAGERNCPIAHGAPIVYPWDLGRFIAGLPIVD